MLRLACIPSVALALLAADPVPSTQTTADDATSGDAAGRSAPEVPGAQHRWLAEDAGSWTIEARFAQPGSDDPMVVAGQSTMTMLWDRYLKEEFTIGEGPLAMRGIGLVGYDARAGEYQAVYCLNTGTSLAVSTGHRDDGGDVLTFVENAPADPHGHDGPALRGRSVIRRESPGRRILEYFTSRGEGPATKRFEMVYTRDEP